MNFKEMLLLAKAGHLQVIETLFTMYRPLLMKEAIVNGAFDEDLFQELSIVFLHCISKFQV